MYSMSPLLAKHQLAKHLRHTCIPLILSAFIGVSGCSSLKDAFDPEKHDHLDRKQDLSRSDYRNMTAAEVDKLEPHFTGETETKVGLGEPPIPAVSDILATPLPPAIGETQLVSIFVTEDVPLKDVLIELGRLADVDIEIDSNIQGGIVFRAQNRPFSEVIERISTLAGLRYTMKNGVLRIERDTPVIRTYSLDFLGFNRSSSSDINITTSVLSSGGGGGGGGGSGGLNSGSGASVAYAVEADFWAAIDTAMQSIIAHTPQTGLSAAIANPQAPAAGGQQGQQTFYVINRQASALTVSLPERQQRMVQEYLQKVLETVSSQVLIEAKIVEVTLNDTYQSGINWDKVFSSDYLSVDVDYNAVSTAGGLTQVIIGGEGPNDPSLDAIVNLTEQFGTTRTLSSPRLHAMNNQQAVLTFARNFVYFDIEIEREQQVSGDTPLAPLLTVTAEPVTIPVGIIISMHPVINTKTNEVTLSIRPTLSRIIDFVEDPTVPILLAQSDTDVNVSNRVPQIEVRELDSLMRMRSGQVMVLGGLMEQVGDNSDTGVPFLSGMPWVGNAFKTATRSEQTRELFILVKATIVGSNTNVEDADKRIYRKFTTDHRPLAF